MNTRFGPLTLNKSFGLPVFNKGSLAVAEEDVQGHPRDVAHTHHPPIATVGSS